MADRMSERDDLSLWALSFLGRTTMAEQRRRALAAYAARAREDPQVAELVELIPASRRSRRNGAGNVISLREARRDRA